jgi:hypothetical protein
MGTNEDKSSTGRVWAAGFYPVMARSHLAPFSLGARFETYEPFISLIFQNFFGPWQTADTESADTGARLYN